MIQLTLILFALMLSYLNPSYASEDKRDSLGKEIKMLISDLSCESASDCESIGYGSRACGGYEQYLIYSKKNVDEELLHLMAQEYFELDKQYNKESGIVSICTVESPKIAQCLNGLCQEADPD